MYFVYPICVRHEETFRHPWASSGIVVHQVGVSSLKNRDIVIQLKLYPLGSTVMLQIVEQM